MAKKKKSKFRYRALLLIPICIALVIAVAITFGSYWNKIFAKYKEKKELESQIIVLKEKEEELKVEVDRLEDPDYVARFARERYMYSKDGEIILRLPEKQ